MKWKATHIVRDGERRIPVRLVDGACYTVDEWKTYSPADWEYSPEDGLTFQGESRGELTEVGHATRNEE